MDMIAMLAGLGETEAQGIERRALEEQAKAEELRKLREQAAIEPWQNMKALLAYGAVFLVGWYARKYYDHGEI